MNSFGEKESSEIPEDVYERFTSEINEVLFKNKQQVLKDAVSFTPKNKGLLLPVIINLSAIVIIIFGLLLFFYLFNLREEAIVSNYLKISTTEGKLLTAYKEETEKKLNQKKIEILEIKQKLLDALEEKNNLKTEMDLRITEREMELEIALRQELEAERQRLKEEGLSEDAIEERISEIEEKRLKEIEELKKRLMREVEEELKIKEAEYDLMIGEYEKNMGQVQGEKAILEDELEKTKMELEKMIQEEDVTAENETSPLEEELQALQEQQQRENLILDQILSMYNKISGNINLSEYEEAIEDLDLLEDYLNQESLLLSPVVQQRKQVDLFIINSLKALIDYEKTRQQQEIVESTLQKKSELIASIITQADELYLMEDFEAALEQYSRLVMYLDLDSETIDKIRDRITEAGIKIAEQLSLDAGEPGVIIQNEEDEKLLAIKERLDLVKEKYQQFLQDNPLILSETPEDKLITLMGAKLLVKQILSSEPVSSQYPQLYGQMEEYYTALGEEKMKEGRYKALSDIIVLINSLLAEGDLSVLEDHWDEYIDEDLKTLYLSIIQKLRDLLGEPNTQ